MTSLGSCDAVSHTLQLREKVKVGCMYTSFALVISVVMRVFSDMGYSSVLTYGAAIQAFGFYSLAEQVKTSRSLAGVSKKSIELFMLYLVMRLACTCTRSGYLPVDRSGDYIYQTFDFISLMYLFDLYYRFHDRDNQSMVRTYQNDMDDFNVMRMVPGCFILAACIHGNLNDSFFFDALWTASMNIDAVAMLPQLWMLGRIGGEVQGMTAHFVLAIMVSRICQTSFWYYGYKELYMTSTPSFHENLPGWQMMAAHAMQCLVCADFVFYYVRARVLGKKFELPGLQ